MQYLLATLVANPMYYVGVGFSIWAAYAFITFLRGFLAGVRHWFRISHHQEHLDHARSHAVQGALLLAEIFILWEILTFIVNLMKAHFMQS